MFFLALLQGLVKMYSHKCDNYNNCFETESWFGRLLGLEPRVCLVRSDMSIARAESALTLLSRQWTNSEMFQGMSQILVDGKDELPDDLAQLEAGCGS